VLSRVGPGVAQRLVETVTVGLPVRVGAATEEVRDLVISPPRARPDGNESCTGAPGHGDLDLFPGFRAADEFGGVLPKFA
jgi:hypothetical protein